MTLIPELDLLASAADSSRSAWVQHYLGTNKKVLGLRMAQVGNIAAEISAKIKTPDELITILDNLYQNGTTFEELAISAGIFGRSKKIRFNFDLNNLYRWLGFTVGWAEVDSLCQSNFTADIVLADWNTWEKFLIKLSADKNIHRRRASLVLLCKTLGQSSDPLPLRLCFKLVDRLKSEKEVLITKAISWVLRSAVKNHGDKIEIYLAENKGTLPKIAYREASRKLTTGRKN